MKLVKPVRAYMCDPDVGCPSNPLQNTALCWYFLLGNGLLTLAVLHLTPYVF